jgi:hypothetical protein
MAEHKRSARQWLTTFTVAASLLISGSPLAFAHPGDVNSTNNGQVINGGTYYNTAGNNTTFTNTSGSGIILHAGSTLTGREVTGVSNPAGNMTGNGGSILINAPGQVVKLDGNVDVNANKAGGFYVGNGGNVQINASFVYQSGSITANGINGGHVNFNVGSVTMGPLASIQTQGHPTLAGFGGNGGTVNIKATGVVDMQRGAVIDTSGKTIGSYDTNLINIQGGLVNLSGILNANGTIPGSTGGTIKVAAVGATTALDWNAMGKASNFITVAEKNALMGKDSFFRHGDGGSNLSQDGNIIIGNFAKISANGANGVNQLSHGCCYTQPSKGSDGGSIFLEACKNIIQYGTITANGGNAGHFIVADNGLPNTTPRDIKGENGLNGGNGGTILLAYHGGLITRAGSLTQAKGGNGANGQDATPMPGFTATGGKGGDGGDGGTIVVKGPVLTNASRNTLNVDGGQAGKEGNFGSICTSCTIPGLPGAPGAPGHIVKQFPTADCPYCAPGLPPGPPPVTPPPVIPPTTPPGQTIVPVVNPGPGRPFAPNSGPVISYNRAVYMARSPLPLEKRVAAAPAPPRAVTPPPRVMMHRATPPKRKIPVRGYW